jgi:hypothetical protein
MNAHEILILLESAHEALTLIRDSKTFADFQTHPEFVVGDVSLTDSLQGIEEVSGAIGYVLGFELSRVLSDCPEEAEKYD